MKYPSLPYNILLEGIQCIHMDVETEALAKTCCLHILIVWVPKHSISVMLQWENVDFEWERPFSVDMDLKECVMWLLF